MTTPEVSIITSSYNSDEYIEKALVSVRKQTVSHSKIEHIVVDDASTDATTDIVKSFDAPYLRLIEKENNSGGTKTLNRGIQEANGQYIVPLDSDDEFRPHLVERMLEIFNTQSTVDFVYSDYYERFPGGKQVYVDTGENILNTITIGIMHRANTLEQFGRYDPTMHFSEYDLLLQYTDAGIKGHHIPEPLFIYHRRGDSQTAEEDWVTEGKQELMDKYGRHLNIREY
jgi:glycosyltransferase involved in cell wall biosynthesis